jgi:23S rRNA (pseudouridine1915-N3)-methyltransferase
LNIKIVSIGHKTSESDLNYYCCELIRRISPYSKIEEVNLKNTRQLFDIISKFKNVVVLDVDGRQLDSQQFSKLLVKDLTFIIGPHDGFNNQEKKLLFQLFETLSLSKLTLPHRLCKVLLLEQIYRGFCIINKHPYAK